MYSCTYERKIFLKTGFKIATAPPLFVDLAGASFEHIGIDQLLI